jgi:type IV secretory pathway VirB10-like protein
MNMQSNDNSLNETNTSSTPSEAAQLETAMPQLGASRSKGVNMKALIFMAFMFVLIAGFIYYIFSSRITNKNVEKKAANQEVLKIPERVRAEPRPPVQPAAIALTNPEQMNKSIVIDPNMQGQPGQPGQPIPLALKRALQGGSVFTSENDPSDDVTKKDGTPGAAGASNSPSSANDQKQLALQDTIARRRAREGGSVSDFLGGVMRPQNQNNPASGAGQASPQSSSSFLPNSANLFGNNSQTSRPNANSQPAAGGINALAQGLGALGQQGGIAGGLAQLAGGAVSADKDDSAATEFFIKSARAIPHSPDTYIQQGTNIRCVMETRIISDINGQTMCAVVENIYSVNATKVLVPKGSRMIGEYKKDSGSSERAGIIWNRLVTPNGLDVDIKSPATDLLGSPGVPGNVDNHWGEKLGAAFLISVASDIFKYGVITRGPKVAKTIVDANTGNVTIVEEPFESELVKNSSKVAAQVLAKSLTREPTITVSQGTLINIITKRDLDFSSIY